MPTSSDRVANPSERREYTSPNGKFRLVIEAVDGWRRLAARAALERLRDGAWVSVWSQPIPQQLGPREALVSNRGQVLMIDEGINVRSRYTLMLIDPEGKIVATHDFDALVRAAGASEANIKANARRGTWMGPPATLAPEGNVALVPFAGRTLAVSLADGSLSLAH